MPGWVGERNRWAFPRNVLAGTLFARTLPTLMARQDDNHYDPLPSAQDAARQAKAELFRQIREQAEAQGRVQPTTPHVAKQAPPPPPRRKLKLRAPPIVPIAQPVPEPEPVEEWVLEAFQPQAEQAIEIDDFEPPAAPEIEAPADPAKRDEPASPQKKPSEDRASVKAPTAELVSKDDQPSEDTVSKDTKEPKPKKKKKKAKAEDGDALAKDADASEADDEEEADEGAEEELDPEAIKQARLAKLKRYWEIVGGKSLTLSVGIHLVILIAATFIVLNYSRTERIDFLPGGGTLQGQQASQALQNNVTRKKSPWLGRKTPLARVAVEHSMSAITLPDAKPDLIELPNKDSFMKAGGGFGGGSGMGGKGGMAFQTLMMFGKQINAKRIAVVLDVSSSMTPFLKPVVNELDKTARGSPVILNWGCGLEHKPPGAKIDDTMRRTQTSKFGEFWREWQQTDVKNIGKPGLPVPKQDLFDFFKNRNNTYFLDYNGVAYAWLALLCDELREADVIYWFSDFEDKVEQKQMDLVLETLKRRKQRLYIHPQIHGQFFNDVVVNLVWPSGGQVIEPEVKDKPKEPKS